MATFLEMQDAIAVETVFHARGADTGFLPQIKLHINEAIRAYENRRFWFNEQAWERDTEVGKEYYALPGDYVRMLTLSIDNPRNVLTGVSVEEIEDKPETENSVPLIYGTFAGQYRLWPKPDKVYRLRLWGVRKFPPLVEDDEAASPWLNEAYDLTCEAAKERIFRKVLHKEEDAMLARDAAEKALNRLIRQTDERLPSTGVRPWL